MTALRRTDSHDLQTALKAVPGVADIDLTDDAGEPRVRVFLEPSADADSVAAAVRSVLAPHGLRAKDAPRQPGPTAPSAPPAPPAPDNVVPVPPRSGIDGLFRIGGMPANGDVARFPAKNARLARIAIEATTDGFSVRAVDSAGRDATTGVGEGEGALDAAIVAAVSKLAGFEEPLAVVALHLQEMDRSSVLSVVIEAPSGERYAGAVVASSSLPFALGQATWMALEGVV